MDQEFLLQFLKKYYFPLAVGFIGIVFCVIGSFLYFLKTTNHEKVTFTSGLESSSSAQLEQQLMVDIEGAVIEPGVYKMQPSAHIRDVLIEAGGLNDVADTSWVERNINLASKLTDGMKIYIPRVHDIKTSQTDNATSVAGETTLNLNTASSQELDSLPGIGQVTAKKIIDSRPYQDISELVSKKIVSQKIFDGIKNTLSL